MGGSVNKKRKPQKEKSTSTHPRKSKTKQQPNLGRKTKPSKSVGKKSQKKAKKNNSKSKRPSKVETKPSIKNKVKSKPSRKQKPFHKPKKDNKHNIKDSEAEDSFQIGNSNADQHSDHHIHQHDHLEAHKHHHKHKESHSHAHDHANDHVHNHKHTHNHVHNHVHKHNEAHEHTAEHAHTEKHHHKHLEYIDAGGWRRRNDTDGETMMDGEPSELIIEKRSFGDAEKQKDNVKNYLKKYIEFYKTAASPEEEDDSDKIFPENSFQENKENLQDDINMNKSTVDDNSQEFQGFNNEEMELFQSENFDFDNYQDSNQQQAEKFQNEKYPDDDVEEITYEEYLALQKKGPVFEEEYENYNEGQGNQFSSDDYTEDYSSYEDQIGFGTNNNLVKQELTDYNAKNYWVPETSELVPIQELEIDLYDENQWQPQADIPLERRDDSRVQYAEEGSGDTEDN